MLGFFLDGDNLAVLVKLNDSEALGVVDVVAEYGGAFVLFRILGGGAENFPEAVAIEDVVTQHHGASIVADEFFAQQECLGQAIGGRLHLVAKMHTKLAAVAQQVLKAGSILRGGDDEDVPDARQHQGG